MSVINTINLQIYWKKNFILPWAFTVKWSRNNFNVLQ